MGDPVKLECALCGDYYYLHPGNERPVEYAELCYTCECFKRGMKRLRDEGDPLVMPEQDLFLGSLILILSAVAVVGTIIWSVFHYVL